MRVAYTTNYKYTTVTRRIIMTNIEMTMISIPNLAKSWGCSRNFLWERCKTDEIPATKIGDRWFIPMWWVKEREHKNFNDCAKPQFSNG